MKTLNILGFMFVLLLTSFLSPNLSEAKNKKPRVAKEEPTYVCSCYLEHDRTHKQSEKHWGIVIIPIEFSTDARLENIRYAEDQCNQTAELHYICSDCDCKERR